MLSDFENEYDYKISELMGVDFTNPELMEGWFKRVFRRIGKRIRARIKRRLKERLRSKLSSAFNQDRDIFSLQTPGGEFTYSPSGLNMTRGVGSSTIQYPLAQAPPVTQTPMQAMAKNPMILVLPLGAIALIALLKKK